MTFEIETLIQNEVLENTTLSNLETPDFIEIDCKKIAWNDQDGKSIIPSKIEDFQDRLEYISRIHFDTGEYEESYFKYCARIINIVDDTVILSITEDCLFGGWNLPQRIMNKINYLDQAI